MCDYLLIYYYFSLIICLNYYFTYISLIRIAGLIITCKQRFVHPYIKVVHALYVNLRCVNENMAETVGVQEEREKELAIGDSFTAMDIQKNTEGAGNSPVDDLYEVERIVGCSKLHVSRSNFAPVFVTIRGFVLLNNSVYSA